MTTEFDLRVDYFATYNNQAEAIFKNEISTQLPVESPNQRLFFVHGDDEFSDAEVITLLDGSDEKSLDELNISPNTECLFLHLLH
ncbi:hypothetical protein BX661DRAFT_198333 [Kickxella alabastrina]|uniref:uncharacterized protein n=1 Tax=Kickxella alabastrina TaxID=61397 RepID=UPI00221F24A3|nr:uncharacterized protein BX661DRAFT_198333 [Kickxella alabastrina]KAI7827736.1 hypothetical protein BX661DRAFT_198333 [Kickxella alabastrina]